MAATAAQTSEGSSSLLGSKPASRSRSRASRVVSVSVSGKHLRSSRHPREDPGGCSPGEHRWSWGELVAT